MKLRRIGCTQKKSSNIKKTVVLMTNDKHTGTVKYDDSSCCVYKSDINKCILYYCIMVGYICVVCIFSCI